MDPDAAQQADNGRLNETILDLPNITAPQKIPSPRKTSLIASMHQTMLWLGELKCLSITSGWPCTQVLKIGSSYFVKPNQNSNQHGISSSHCSKKDLERKWMWQKSE